MNRNLQESIVLQNTLIAIIPKMIKDKDKQLFQFVRNFTREHTSFVSDNICKEISINLLKEVFALINQIWANDSSRFDEALIKEKNILKTIKSQIAKEGKTLPFNNKELYKRIRESIVHNSKNNPNFIYNLQNFELNLGKINDEDYIINLNLDQLINLVYVLFKNTKQNKTYATLSIHIPNSITTHNDIKDNIKIVNEENNITTDLDNNQIERAYNYFRYIKNGSNIFESDEEIKSAIRFPYNAEPLFVEKLRTLLIVKSMNSGTSWKELTDKYPYLLNSLDMLNFYFSLISNLLFTIASTQTNNELEEMLYDCVTGLYTDNIRHLRNSLCHGRYFHDFNKTFYFYDGKKQLDFKLKLTIDNINKILDKVSKGYYSVTMLK